MNYTAGARRVGRTENLTFASSSVYDLTTSCDAVSLRSASPNPKNRSSGNTEHDDVKPLKDAFVSRNMDFANCCLQAMLGDLPTSERPYFGHLLSTVMKAVEDATVANADPSLQSIFSEVEDTPQISTDVVSPVERKKTLGQGCITTASREFSKIPNIYSKRSNGKRAPSLQISKPQRPFTCTICGKLKDGYNCSACAIFSRRVDKRVQLGEQPPSCKHKYFEKSHQCRSCRYYKFKEERMKKYGTNQAPSVLAETDRLSCLGCQTPFSEGSTKCKPCYHFVRRILSMRKSSRSIPKCSHKNYEGSPKCNSCRFNRFLKRKNVPLPKCGSCFEDVTTDKCESCHKFGTSLDKAFGEGSVPQCQHQNREGAPVCLNCRYHLWKEGEGSVTTKNQPRNSEKESRNSIQEPVRLWMEEEPEMDIKPDLKRIKIEFDTPVVFEMG